MMNDKIIANKVFSQKFVEKNKAKLFNGEYHPDFSSYSTLFVKPCKVQDSDPFFANQPLKDMWNCRLSHNIVGDNTLDNFDQNSIKIYQNAIIDSGSNSIMAPGRSLKYFLNYFKSNPLCKIEKDPTSATTII